MPQVPFDEPKHTVAQEDSNTKRTRTKLPPIPDLRFESSFLKNIRPFVKVKRVGKKIQETHEVEGEVTVGDEDFPREIIEIEWRQVLWVTLKDQLISPLLQGALWGFASLYLKPFSARLTSSIARGPRKDGEGVSWLRNRWQRLGFRNNSVAGQSSPSNTT